MLTPRVWECMLRQHHRQAEHELHASNIISARGVIDINAISATYIRAELDTAR